VATPDLLPGGKGGPAPEADPRAQAPRGSSFHTWWHRPPRGGSGPWWPFLSTLSLWAHGGAGPVRARGEVRRPRPQLSGPGRTPCRPKVEGEVTDTLAPFGLDTLAGGTPVRMCRQNYSSSCFQVRIESGPNDVYHPKAGPLRDCEKNLTRKDPILRSSLIVPSIGSHARWS
jgi:hypothetical protein